MTATYMPLVGGANIIEVRDSGGTACDLAQIAGVDAEGRAGSLKTTFLFAMFGAVEAATSLNSLFDTIGGFSLFAPYSAPVPTAPGFDYSSVIPVCNATLVSANFEPAGRAWPATLDAYLSVANLNAPGTIYQLQVVPISTNPTSPPSQYGEYRFSIRGGVPDPNDPILSPLVLVEVDFSHSVGN